MAEKIDLFQSDQTKNKLQYTGYLSQIFLIWIKILLFSIFTFGIYGFWGRTNFREYVFSRLRLSNLNFKYTGTGYELFIGFLKVIPFLFIYAILNAFFESSRIYTLLAFIFIIYAYYFIDYSALRYRLFRTTLNGINFGLRGSAHQYALMKLKYFFLNIITLGLSIPFSDKNSLKYVTKNMTYGRTYFSFKNPEEKENQKRYNDLFKSHITTLILAIPTLFISRFWYIAALTRYRYAHTQLGELQFEAEHTGSGEFLLFLQKLLIPPLSFGLGVPFVVQQRIKYNVNQSFIIGDIKQFKSITDYKKSETEEFDKSADYLDSTDSEVSPSDVGMFGFDFTLD